MRKVKAHDGSEITVSQEVIDHIVRKHPQMLSVVGFERERLVASLVLTLENPVEIHANAGLSKYYLRKLNDLYLNIIVIGDTVKTAYLIGDATYKRMSRARWLRRLY